MSEPGYDPWSELDVTFEDGADAADTITDALTPGARVSVVLPVYNEVENIPWVLDRLRATFCDDMMAAWRPYEVIFVEDGSDDGTSELIDEYARHQRQIVAVHLARNWGQSAALAAGFEQASGEVIVPMDADGQNDPKDIPRLLDELEAGYDCVSGWRRDRQDPWHKRWPSAIQTRLAKRLGPDINDFGCTLKAYRREAIESISLYGEGHRYIPAKLYKNGYSVTEVEVNHRPREHGESRYGAGRLVRGFADLLFHYFWSNYSTRPIHFLGGIGFAFMAIGGLIGVVSVGQKFLLGVELAPRVPRLVLISTLIIFGLQLIIFGFLAEMITKMHYDDREEYRIDRVVG